MKKWNIFDYFESHEHDEYMCKICGYNFKFELDDKPRAGGSVFEELEDKMLDHIMTHHVERI